MGKVGTLKRKDWVENDRAPKKRKTKKVVIPKQKDRDRWGFHSKKEKIETGQIKNKTALEMSLDHIQKQTVTLEHQKAALIAKRNTGTDSKKLHTLEEHGIT